MGDQNGELACLEMIAKLNRKKKNSSFFSATDSANEKPGIFCLLQSSQLPFPFHKTLLPSSCGTLLTACHGFRPQAAILCCSQINLTIYFRSTYRKFWNDKKKLVCIFYSILKKKGKNSQHLIFNQQSVSTIRNENSDQLGK